jgi:hypothetical protein
MATIKEQPTQKATPTTPQAAIPKPKKPRAKKAEPKKPTRTKLINGIEHAYCWGYFAWYPLTAFKDSARYSSDYLKSKGL